ncbi:MAG: hypothetical protein A2087_03740 [Spirochaetes bacterium GWD1_61_31]|nr:MAG: hypothetical protein A2Y37_09465 [Spirochaetes bacterium GWB1_60_80]OHD32835.1 MAG: hypothetical protein A2004_11160 [Spirochaetes bacterium GWC1_61_12]OHD35078.1 MAG: hypothetical protein A2087_03740 [Spirochaetes bacterium GWD1_61_31]OHD42756.1 MAG: hypothetical protein A2Y35_05730 [Spirochaetes bacterium GWE1_60_18]OHD58608.1 MAG: hypothetical protein A2Y32_04655 [Spirochaetes bacterium GWF1_60_12]HAP44444.1 hypothetical protein [Spirochaetaceae bacterium]
MAYAGSMRADMHLHSQYSDGSEWPASLARQAATFRLELACLTDHDTMGGTAEFLQAAREAGLTSFPGVEIDCVDKAIKYKSELLVYFPAGSYNHTAELLIGLLQDRRAALETICQQAAVYFGQPDISYRQLLIQRSGNGAREPSDPSQVRLGKSDVFRLLLRRNLVPAGTVYADFKKTWFDSGPLSRIKINKPTVRELAKIVRRDSGFLVLPHFGHEFGDNPGIIRKQQHRLKDLLAYFRSCGVSGVEMYLYKGDNANMINASILNQAERLGYFVTWGSDCHGANKEKRRLGRFYGDFTGFPVQ